MIIAKHQGLKTMTADISNAFCTAKNVQPDVWVECGPEFGDREGQKATLNRALYGMASSSRAFHDYCGDVLMEMGFRPSRADQDLWIRRSDDHDAYDYIATWVDDIICVAKKPEKYMSIISQQFALRNEEINPDKYLGSDMRTLANGMVHVCLKTYITEAIRKYEAKYSCLAKQSVPMKEGYHPKLEEGPPLNEEDQKQYQYMMGVLQWICTMGHIDIVYATSSMSRFSNQPRQSHLDNTSLVTSKDSSHEEL